MAKVTQAAKVGLFVLVSAGAAYGIFRMISKSVGSGDGYVVHAYLKDVTGLAAHTRVTVAGIPVGSIDKILLENGVARVDVMVRRDLPLYTNATLGKKSTSLLGEFAIVLTPGTEDTPKLKDGDEIHTIIEAASTDQIMNDVARIADRLKLVAEQVANAMGSEQGGKNMQAILQNLAEATAALNRTLHANEDLIHDTLLHVNAITAQGEPQIHRILDNIRVVTEDVRVMLSSTADRQDKEHPGGEIRDTVNNLRGASKKLEDALEHIDSIAARVDRGEGTIGRLSKDDGLITEVQEVAEGVNDYVGRITALQTVVGLRADYNFISSTVKSYVELRLQPREDKYYVIELVNDPKGLTTYKLKTTNTTDPNQANTVNTLETETTNAFRFSLQFAKRMGPFTGRFGIKESTGGIGLDTTLLSDRMNIVQDLFGFGETIQTRYRVYLGYEFVRHLWLIVGSDYIFSNKDRDFFLGLQLRFTDDDLKTILPFAGGLAGATSK